MSVVLHGRFAAQIDGPFVVFVIGMRINQLWKIRSWLPVLLSMRPMLQELYAHPEKGFLGSEYLFTLRGPVLLQYWRSFDHLDGFARSKDDPHLPAWQRFNRTAAKDGNVGIFHETYQINAGAYECVYGNMPRFGLAAAAEHVPAVGDRATARRRIGGEPDEIAVPTTY
jgi:hypothetical protein